MYVYVPPDDAAATILVNEMDWFNSAGQNVCDSGSHSTVTHDHDRLFASIDVLIAIPYICAFVEEVLRLAQSNRHNLLC